MNAVTSLASEIEPEPTADRDYARIAAAIAFITQQQGKQPSLDDVAAHVGLSPFHFQRLFKRWAGVSPKQFLGYLTVAHAKAVLDRSASLLDAAYDVGLSGPSRLHDLFVAFEAMTPGDYKTRGESLVIRHGVHDTPFGPALVLVTDRGVCGVDFVDGREIADALAAAQARWPLSHFTADQKAAAGVVARMFSGGAGENAPERLLLRGTNFQIQVWSALLRVPAGAIVSYGDLARAIDQPGASRAVGEALAQNTLAYLVPCHRVLRSTGLFKSYRWGAERRHAMLAWEAAKAESQAA